MRDLVTIKAASQLLGISISAIHQALESKLLGIRVVEPYQESQADPTTGWEERDEGGRRQKRALLLIPKSELIRLAHARGYWPESLRHLPERAAEIYRTAEALRLFASPDANSEFGKRIFEREWSKRYLAAFAVRHVHSRTDERRTQIYIADGALCLWAGIAVLDLFRERSATIITNSVAIAYERVLRFDHPVQVECEGGLISESEARFGSVYRPPDREGPFLFKVGSSHFSILSVPAFTAREGVFNGNSHALWMLGRVLTSTIHNVIVVPFQTVGPPRVDRIRPILNVDEWAQILADERRRFTLILERPGPEVSAASRGAWDCEFRTLQELAGQQSSAAEPSSRIIAVDVPAPRFFPED